MFTDRGAWGCWLISLVVAMAAPPRIRNRGGPAAPVSPAPLSRPKSQRLNPAAVAYKLPNQIHWTATPAGAETATLVGDPSKPGLYIVLIKWTPHHMSHPHWHPNDRYITVLSGTWWVGTGTKFDPAGTVPMPAGSFVTDLARQVHYDGAKDGDAVIEIVGMGPATATPAEGKP